MFIDPIFSESENRPANDDAFMDRIRARATERRKAAAKRSSWDQAGAILDTAAATAIAANQVKPSAAYVARKFVTVDIIRIEEHGHGLGWPSFECERSLHATTFRSHLTLVEFARKHFKAGILRPLGAGRYAVLVRKPETPSAWGAEFDRAA